MTAKKTVKTESAKDPKQESVKTESESSGLGLSEDAFGAVVDGRLSMRSGMNKKGKAVVRSFVNSAGVSFIPEKEILVSDLHKVIAEAKK